MTGTRADRASRMVDMLPELPALVRVRDGRSDPKLCLWRDGRLLDLSKSGDRRVHSIDSLLRMPVETTRPLLDDPAVDDLPRLMPERCEWLAPCDGQEVWAAGVTYMRSKEARMEESAARDLYARVYEADRPELFFKAAGWRVSGPGGEVGIRSDSLWNVPEPELAVLSNSAGEVVAYACGNDMSSRSIEGENPLYLPQAKVYDKSCSIGPAAVLAWHVGKHSLRIELKIRRDGGVAFTGTASTSAMVREPAALVRVLGAVYGLPVGAWLLTGTAIVPPETFTCRPGDEIDIAIEALGRLVNRVELIAHSGATAPPVTH